MTGATIMCISVLLTYFGTLKYRNHSDAKIATFNLKLILNQIFIALKNKSFLIARDHVGIIPLYYGYDINGTLFVASELKAIEGICKKIIVIGILIYLVINL